MADSNPKNVSEAYEEYTQYKALKKKDELAGTQEGGTLAYIV